MSGVMYPQVQSSLAVTASHSWLSLNGHSVQSRLLGEKKKQVSPIFQNIKEDPWNYRPVSLTFLGNLAFLETFLNILRTEVFRSYDLTLRVIQGLPRDDVESIHEDTPKPSQDIDLVLYLILLIVSSRVQLFNLQMSLQISVLWISEQL